MPKTIINYQKSIIYKIQHEDNPELLYVGSTTDFTKRKSHHKSNCNNDKKQNYNFKIYKMIRDNGGWEMFKMIIIKEYPCNNKIELLLEEDKIMIELKSNMNEHRASRTRKQYREDNKEQIKQYKEDHKEQIKQKDKQYKEDHKEQIKQYREDHKEQSKQYKEDHKEQSKQYNKLYREKNKIKNL